MNSEKYLEKGVKNVNVIFLAKLSFQEQYPKISIYETPNYIKKLRERKKLIKNV